MEMSMEKREGAGLWPGTRRAPWWIESGICWDNSGVCGCQEGLFTVRKSYILARIEGVRVRKLVVHVLKLCWGI